MNTQYNHNGETSGDQVTAAALVAEVHIQLFDIVVAPDATDSNPDEPKSATFKTELGAVEVAAVIAALRRLDGYRADFDTLTIVPIGKLLSRLRKWTSCPAVSAACDEVVKRWKIELTPSPVTVRATAAAASAGGGGGGGGSGSGSASSFQAKRKLSQIAGGGAAAAASFNFRTVTITFGDQAENHVGMQKIGNGLASEGFSVADLMAAKAAFEAKGAVQCEVVDLHEHLPSGGEQPDDQAKILIVRNGVSAFGVDASTAFAEQMALSWDTKALMYGRVVNKHARHNLCFDSTPQEPNYAAGEGRVVAYPSVPCIAQIRDGLQGFLGGKAAELAAEGNFYVDTRVCGIGFHGDSERKKVVGVRLGETIPLHFQWFQGGSPVGTRAKLRLNSGDVYVMSQKATGWDWKRRSALTLRHAAGCSKFLTIK